MTYGILAKRSGGSVFGAASAWAKGSDGKLALFATLEEAQAQAKVWNDRLRSVNVSYRAAEYEY